MKKRKIKVALIKHWITSRNPKGEERLAIRSEVSLSLIQKLVRGKYMSEPSVFTMKALCKAMEMPLDELFPVQRKKRESHK